MAPVTVHLAAEARQAAAVVIITHLRHSHVVHGQLGELHYGFCIMCTLLHVSMANMRWLLSVKAVMHGTTSMLDIDHTAARCHMQQSADHRN